MALVAINDTNVIVRTTRYHHPRLAQQRLPLNPLVDARMTSALVMQEDGKHD